MIRRQPMKRRSNRQRASGAWVILTGSLYLVGLLRERVISEAAKS